MTFRFIRFRRFFSLLCCVALGQLANAGNWYFSALGDDANSGATPDAPYQTIDKLNTLVLMAGDTVFFRSGDTFRGQINLQYSGSSGAPIVFTAYGAGARPIISGAGEALSGWVGPVGGIYAVKLDYTPYNLIVNSVQAELAKGNLLTVNTATGKTIITSSGITQASGYWNDARICVRTSLWTWESREVGTQTGTQVTFSTPTSLATATGYQFFFYDKRELLDAAGEWYFNSSTDSLYYYPPSAPSGLNIKASKTAYGLSAAAGTDFVEIWGLSFEDQYTAGVYIPGSGSSHLLVEDCAFARQLKYGVYAEGSDHAVRNSSFDAIDGKGVEYNACLSSAVQYCHFNHIGPFRNYGVDDQDNLTAISIRGGGSDNCQVDHNRIDSTGYCGIRCDGTNSVVERNILSNCMLLLSDGGAIKTYGDFSSNITFRHNIITACNGNDTGAPGTFKTPGIYFDFYSHDCRAENNIIYNTEHNGIFLNGGTQNMVVKNNLVYGFDEALNINDRFSPPDVISGDSITDNIFFARSVDDVCIKQSSQNGYPDVGYIDENQYINPYNDEKIAQRNLGALGTPPTDYSLAEWRSASGYDLLTAESPFNWTAPEDFSSLFINDTDADSTFDLRPAKYLSLDNVEVCDPFVLPAYSAVILIGTGNVCLNSLPVELIRFEASVIDNREVLLQWALGASADLEMFELESSRDGLHYQTIAFVAPGGSYRYVDTSPMVGLNYYRLKVREQGGSIAYSASITARIEAGVSIVGPNPFDDAVWLDVTHSGYVFTLHDAFGHQMLQEVLESGRNRLTLNHLSPGIYYWNDGRGNSGTLLKL